MLIYQREEEKLQQLRFLVSLTRRWACMCTVRIYSLTLIGGVFGLFLGRLLHIYIMLTVEMDAIMFGYAIKPVSYIYSYLITLIFSVVVNLAMYGKLKEASYGRIFKVSRIKRTALSYIVKNNSEGACFCMTNHSIKSFRMN